MAKGKQDFKVAPQERTVTRSKAATHAVIYANNAEVQLSPWDFKIRLGQVQSADEKELQIEEVATIYMSPAHMKAFLVAMQTNVGRFEEIFGPIKSPREAAQSAAAKTPSEG